MTAPFEKCCRSRRTAPRAGDAVRLRDRGRHQPSLFLARGWADSYRFPHRARARKTRTTRRMQTVWLARPSAKGRTSDVAGRSARRSNSLCQKARDDRQRQRVEADDGRRVPGVAARRPRDLHLRRARQGRHHASGLPQHRPHAGAPLQRAARPQAQRQAAGADRHRQRRHDARLLQVPEDDRGIRGRPRRDRRMGQALLRLARPRARLQGGIPRHARRQRRVLFALAGERQALVSLRPGARAVRQPRHHPSSRRPQPPAAGSGRRLLPRGEGDGRRHRRVGRQGGGDGLRAHQLHLRRPPRADPGRRQELSPRSS